MGTDYRKIGTDNRKKIYAAIVNYIHDKGYSPTVRELAERCNLAVSNVHNHIEHLEADGMIYREKPNSARTIRLVEGK